MHAVEISYRKFPASDLVGSVDTVNSNRISNKITVIGVSVSNVTSRFLRSLLLSSLS